MIVEREGVRYRLPQRVTLSLATPPIPGAPLRDPLVMQPGGRGASVCLVPLEFAASW